MRDLLEGPFKYGYSHKSDRAHFAQSHLEASAKALGHLLSNQGYKVRCSGTAPNLPIVPWVAVLDPDVTSTAKSGLYLVYLFSTDLTRIYLTMNQGATARNDAWKHKPRPNGLSVEAATIGELELVAQAIRAELDESLLAGTSAAIHLGSASFLPMAYEAGTIAAIEYKTSDLPTEIQLISDLQWFLSIYDASVDALASLNAQNPEQFALPAFHVPPRRAEANPKFAPKSADDYVVQIQQRTQVRSRRHEAIVKSFGLHAREKGWEPQTNVHPMDLLLKRDRDKILCEIKVVKANSSLAVRESIGQLYEYRHFFPDKVGSSSPLLAVFSSDVGAAYVELLNELRIGSVWAVDEQNWAGSSDAEALGLVS